MIRFKMKIHKRDNNNNNNKSLWGGGGNIRARENKMKKNSCTPINPKKYSCHGLKLKFIQGI